MIRNTEMMYFRNIKEYRIQDKIIRGDLNIEGK